MLKIEARTKGLTVGDETLIYVYRNILPDCDSVEDFHKELLRMHPEMFRKDKKENVYGVRKEAGTVKILHLSPGGKIPKVIVTVSE